MSSLLKNTCQRRVEHIKTAILSGRPFEDDLERLYTDLRLSAQYRQMVQIYQLLRLYVPEGKNESLYHPALLQAFISLQMTEEAIQCTRILQRLNPQDPEIKKLTTGLKIRQESTLPSYTPISTLSHYAQRTAGAHCPSKLPDAWQTKLGRITPQSLAHVDYFRKQKQLARVPKIYRTLLLEQFDELILNYLLEHIRSVVVLSGALLELLLAFYLHEKLHLTQAAPNGKKPKAVFDLNLSDLLSIYAQKQLLPAHVLRLCRAARMHRNYIHIGKEIVEKNPLRPTAQQICLLAVLETIDALFPRTK